MSRPRCIRPAAVLLAVALAQGCAPDAPPPLAGMNVVLINVDALRADHLGAYGYRRDTSPRIDRLAAGGVVFERAVSNSSFTRESVAALFSGRLPSSGGATGWRASPSPQQPTLAQRLAAAGYTAGFFSNTTMLASPRFTRGFEAVEHLSERWGVSGAGGKLTARALSFVQSRANEKLFLYLHYLDPHGPYEPPYAAQRSLGGALLPDPLHLYEDVRPNVPGLVEDGLGPGDLRYEDLVLRYDAEIADTDAAIGALIDGLDAQGVLDRTAIVITADHGEEFLEHGFVEHAWTLYEESLHVPLIFWAPARLAPERVAGRVSSVDVAPTLLSLLGVPHEAGDFDGTSLFVPTATGLRATVPDAPIIAELLVTERNVLRAVILDDWKYIASQTWVPPEDRAAFELAGSQRADDAPPAASSGAPPVREELYLLAEDPHEQNDRLVERPEVARRLRERLDVYRRSAEARGLSSPANPAGGVGPDEARRLHALGYVE